MKYRVIKMSGTRIVGYKKEELVATDDEDFAKEEYERYKTHYESVPGVQVCFVFK